MRKVFLVLMLLLTGPPVAADGTPPVILVWGDSLSAAYGIPLESGWVQLLQARLRDQGYPHRVVNGSVSGETTSGGLARLPAALQQHRPAVVVIELGGNDGLRGLPLKSLRANLGALVHQSRAAGAKVLLCEMQIPPNYGAAYTQGFQRTFAEAAQAGPAHLVPFLLGPIATDPRWFQDDGIHPTVAAQPRLLDAVWPVLHSVLSGTHASRGRKASPPALQP
jgi:acyl-CoA thioesterase-1